MKYKLITKTFYDKKEYTVYKALCKKRWYLPWEGIGLDGSLHCYDELHEWYNSKEDAINALKNALKEIEVQKNYPIIKEEKIELITEEEKELVIKDLCGRSPYGVKVVTDSTTQITVGCKIRSKTNPNVILSIISSDCHEDEFECSNGSVLSLKQIEKYYDLII